MTGCILSGLMLVGVVYMLIGSVIRTVVKRHEYCHKVGVGMFGGGALLTLPNMFVFNTLGAVVLMLTFCDPEYFVRFVETHTKTMTQVTPTDAVVFAIVGRVLDVD